MLAACGGELVGEATLGESESELTRAQKRQLRRLRRADAGTTTGGTVADAGTTTPTTPAPVPPVDAGTSTGGTSTGGTATAALFSEDFAGGISRWTDWYSSPGWVYNNGGQLAITPAAATHGAPYGAGDYNYTHAAIAAYCPTKTGGLCGNGGTAWKNVAYEARVNTVRQTRTGGFGNEPNAWEVAWIMFRFRDQRHYYYMHLKARHLRNMSQDYGGIEIGKYNCSSTCGLYEQQAGQEVIWNVTANDLRSKGITYAALNTWYDYRIETRDVTLANGKTGVNIIVKVNGIEVANVTDDGNQLGMGHSAPTPPITGGAGSIALYSEDAAVLFDNVKVLPLP